MNRKGKILVVDDDEINLISFREALLEEFDVITAGNGQEALTLFLEHRDVAMVLSDHRMPGMTGVDLFAKLLAIDSRPMRIIITGYPEAEDIIQAINAGQIYKFLCKPCPIRELQAEMRRAYEIFRINTEREKLLLALEEKNTLLARKTKKLEESNVLLQGLIEQNQWLQKKIETHVLCNIKNLLGPALERLKFTRLSSLQTECLAILEQNLGSITSAFSTSLSGNQYGFTQMEIRVANCILHGKSNKESAQLLNISTRTIETHRFNIRKKLGILNKKSDLQSCLLSLPIDVDLTT